jgi:Mrp family chromosome partitioning ATPase
LTQQYDLIVIDSPPVVMVSDARIVAAACDAVVLVLRAEKTPRRLSTHARDLLHSVGAKMVGVVINDVARGKGEYGYYSGYSYGYYYGYGYGSRNGNGNGKGGLSESTEAVKQITEASPRSQANTDA